MYRFKSRATHDLLMLHAVGQDVLRLLGKDPDHPGVIRWQDMAVARQLLTDAAQKTTTAKPTHDEDDVSEETPNASQIDLSKRIVPLLMVLKRCEQAQVDLVWGV